MDVIVDTYVQPPKSDPGFDLFMIASIMYSSLC
jgi:hypothetical protein